MGLEMVEIVMAVEETYGIEISNEEAAQCATFGKFVDTLHRRLAPAEGMSPKEFAINRLRVLVSSEFGVAPEKLGPKTILDSVNPGLPEEEFWTRLMKRLGHDPEVVVRTSLHKPRWFLKAVLFVYVLQVTVQTYLLSDFCGCGCDLWVSMLLSALELFLVFKLIRPLRRKVTEITSRYRTLSELAPLIGSSRETGISREELACGLRTIVARELGLREDQIHEHSHFVNDLGCG